MASPIESALPPTLRLRSLYGAPLRWIIDKELSRGFWIFFTAAFFFDFGFAIYFFLFNLYLLDLHFNEQTMGLIGGALTLGSVAGTLPIGKLAERFGLRPLLFVCFASAAALGVLRTTMMQQSAQVCLAFIAGIAMCIWGVCFLPSIARLTTEQNRAFAFSLIFSVSIGTSALGGIICGYLPGWLNAAGFVISAAKVKQLILLAACALATLGIIPLLFLKLPAAQQSANVEDRLKHSKVRLRWKLHPFLVRFLPAMALWTAVLASFTPFANVYLSRDLGIPLSSIGFIFSIAQILQLCVGMATPLLSSRFGLINGIVATQVATALAMVGLAAAHEKHLAIVLYLSFTATQWMSSPSIYNLLMSRTPDDQRSTASAMTMFSNALLQSASTAGAGVLFVRFGYPRVLVGIAVVAIIAALLLKSLIGSWRESSSTAATDEIGLLATGNEVP
jgi:MFS family permease